MFLTLVGDGAYKIMGCRDVQYYGMYTDHAKCWYSRCEPIVSFPLEMGLKCRTLVQKFYEMENGDVITPVYPALMFSITHSGRNNIYGVFGTYKCRRCRKLKRRVKPPQGLIH